MANGDSARSVFLDYNRDQLNAQYNDRHTHPDHPNIIERWATRSRPLRESTQCLTDLRYGELPRQRVDLFLPQGFNGCLHVFIHGGYWQSMERRFYGLMGDTIAKTGAVAAVIDHSFAQQRPLAHILDEVGLAVNLSHQAAEQRGYSPSHLRLSGHGSGALMALAAGTRSLGPRTPLPLLQIDCIGGLYDLEPLRHIPLGEALGLSRESARTLSPIYSRPREGLDLLRLFTGSEETAEIRRQNNALAAAWADEKLSIEKHPVAGQRHFSLLDWYAQALIENDRLTRTVALPCLES